MLKNLLMKHLGDEAKATAFMDEMKQSKIFTASEENMDKRYAKLKGDFDSKTKEHQEALTLIEQLKASSEGNSELLAKIGQYESTIADLQAKTRSMQEENAIKMALLAGKAKADDIDYLMFKMKSAETKVKVNDKGEVTNISDILEGLKKNYPSHFEAQGKREVETKELPNNENDKEVITKEMFDKMSYNARNELYQKNKEVYDKLAKEGKE